MNQREVQKDQVLCANCDGALMQAHAITSTPNLHMKGVVYVTILYRCTILECRRVKHITDEVRMPYP